jgi:hypothetical protein
MGFSGLEIVESLLEILLGGGTSDTGDFLFLELLVVDSWVPGYMMMFT